MELTTLESAAVFVFCFVVIPAAFIAVVFWPHKGPRGPF